MGAVDVRGYYKRMLPFCETHSQFLSDPVRFLTA